jgi:uncharacterized damage-inducible protein DinB
MFTTVQQFLTTWRHESASTARVLAQLTDASLDYRLAPTYRSLGDLAWHIVTSPCQILSRTGLAYDAPRKGTPRPPRASQIQSAYVDAAGALAQAVERNWDDAALRVEDQMFGQSWPRGLTLDVMLRHEIHHRGQLTALMRGAGLRVPGVYGPSADEAG